MSKAEQVTDRLLHGPCQGKGNAGKPHFWEEGSTARKAALHEVRTDLCRYCLEYREMKAVPDGKSIKWVDSAI